MFNSTLNALFPPSPSDTPPHSPSIGEAAISAAAALSSAAAGAEYEGVRKENAREEDVRRDSGQSPFDEDEESTQSGDGEVGQGEAGTEPVRVPPKAREALANWKWGYVNFAKETKLVWRWWIWK